MLTIQHINFCEDSEEIYPVQMPLQLLKELFSKWFVTMY